MKYTYTVIGTPNSKTNGVMETLLEACGVSNIPFSETICEFTFEATFIPSKKFKKNITTFIKNYVEREFGALYRDIYISNMKTT